uniref:Zinc finger protein CONSTANS-LIKE 5 n=1 Tax=Aegilops tauschii TaxID=37682 RepID=M8CGH5_AEGTA
MTGEEEWLVQDVMDSKREFKRSQEEQWEELHEMMALSTAGDVYVPELDVKQEVKEEMMEDRLPTPTPQNPPAPAPRHRAPSRKKRTKSLSPALSSADLSAGDLRRARCKVEEQTVVGGGEGGLWGLAGRPCDTCAVDAARLYCRSDGAYLCAGCDARAHGAGSRHARVWLCEVCEHAPAAVTCRADAAALCATCDADIHSANPLASRHERLPVTPFFGALADPPQPAPSPSSAAATQEDADDDGSNEAEAASWLLPEPGDSPEDSTATFFPDSDAYLDLDFVRSMDGIKAIGVPVAPSELDVAGGALFYPEHSMNHSMSTSEVAVVPDALSAGGAPAPAPSVAVVASKGKEREARLMRYREKRKNRRFQKTIRYASRKAYAETRPRIKGRFAKRTAEDDALERDGPFSPASSAHLASDGDYGVVPSF